MERGVGLTLKESMVGKKKMITKVDCCWQNESLGIYRALLQPLQSSLQNESR